MDIVGTAPAEMWQLKQAKLSTGYLSPELQAMPKGSYDPEGYWSAFEVTPIVVASKPSCSAAPMFPTITRTFSIPNTKGR